MLLIGACNNGMMAVAFGIAKKIFLLIQIAVPIVLIVSAVFELTRLAANPDKKGGTKPLINKVIAAVIVFFIPMLVNLAMYLAGDGSTFSSCWNAAMIFFQ